VLLLLLLLLLLLSPAPSPAGACCCHQHSPAPPPLPQSEAALQGKMAVVAQVLGVAAEVAAARVRVQPNLVMRSSQALEESLLEVGGGPRAWVCVRVDALDLVWTRGVCFGKGWVARRWDWLLCALHLGRPPCTC
jgi:protein-disulfide isomerase